MEKPAEIIVFKYESATCQIIDWSDGTANLANVYAYDRKKGHATELLTEVMLWVDERGLFLKTAAEAHGSDERLNTAQLVEFYSKFGFARTENYADSYIYMERPSKKF